MKYSNTIEYNINTKLDSSGLTKLQAQIKQLENSMQQMSNRELLNSDKVQAAKTQLEGLNTALTNSFNSSLGILDLSKFRAELDANGVSAKGLQSAFNMMGAEGQAALNGLTTQIANFNGGMERTSSQIDKIFTTFSNTFRWGLVSSFFSQFMNAIHSSVDYVKELDDSLTQIMLVTDYNRDSMNEFAQSANEAAKAVSMTTTGMTNASLIFAQQGYDLGQSQELATLSAKLANASQQDTATTSDQITAYMNAYGLEGSIEELTQQMDNWALIANVSAADVGELAQASQRAASMANAVGVSGEQLAAQIATIESVTREAPEQIGNGLKTLYARFSDIAAGKEDEDGFGLGKVTSELNKIGVQVLNEMGQIRDVGDIMEDLMVIWDDLDQTSKVAAAQALAGKYQVNRFMALMDNSDMYQEYKGATGSAATGTLDQMNEEFANSIEGRSAKLQASLEGLFSTIFNTDDIYPWIDAAQGAVDLLQQFFDALGGGKTVLLGITSLLGQAFNQNIARSINDTLANRQLMQTRQRNIESVNDTLDRVGIDRNSGVGQYISNTAEQAKQGAINDAQYDAYMSNVQNWINAQTALTQSEEDLQDTIVALNMAYGKAVNENNAIFKDPETGSYNTQFAQDERANLNQNQINKIMKQADFSEAIAGAQNYSISLQQLQALQEKYNGSAENSKQMMNQIAVASDQAQIALEQLYNTGVISDEMFENMRVAIEQTVEALKDDGEITEQTEKQLNDLIAAMARFSNMAENTDANQLKKMLLGGVDEFRKKENAVAFNQTQVNRAETDANESKANIDSQQNIKDILDVLNAVQQLTFAWQAFQNLGSLWANEDLSTGEKVVQTVINLTMAMSQLIPAIDALKNGSLGQSFQQINDVLSKAQTGEMDFSSDERMIEINEKLNSLLDKRTIIHKKISEAKEEIYNTTKQVAEAENESAKNAMTGAQLIFKKTLAKKTEKEQNELISMLEKEQIVNEAAITTAETTRSAIGKMITAELVKQVALQAALTFGIPLLLAGLGAAVGYYQQQREEAEKLKQERLEASNQQTDELKKNAANIQELYNNYKETGEAADGLREALEQQAEALGIVVTATDDYDSLKQKIDEATASQLAYNAALRGEDFSTSKTTATDAGLTFEDKKALGIDTTSASYVNTANGQMQYQADGSASADIAETVEKSKELVDLEQQSIANRNAELALLDRGNPKEEEKYQLLKQQNTESQERINRLSNYIEGNKEYLDNQYAQAENTVLATALNSNIFKGVENTNGEFNATSYEEAFQYVKNITEGLSLTEEQQQQLAATALEYAGNLEGAAEAAEKLKNQSENIPSDLQTFLPKNNFRSEEEQQSVQQSLNLSDDEYASYEMTLVDSNKNLEALAQEADYLEKNTEALQKHRSELEQETKTLISEKEALEEKADKLEKNEKAYNNLQREINNYNKQIDKNQKELKKEIKNAEDVRDQLEDLENKIIETAVGAKELSKVWDDNAAVLRDSSAGFTEQAEAINNLAPGLAHLLNMDLSEIQNLGTDFFTDPQHLNDIEAAINGDVEALQRLRGEVAEPILIDAHVDPNVNIDGEMINIIDMANQILPDLEAGATIDYAPFVAGLNAMVASTQGSAQQIEAIIAACERLGIQMIQDGTTTMLTPRVDMQAIGSIDVGGEGIGGGIATAAASVAKSIVSSVSFDSTEIPKYKYVKTSGGSGFNGGANTGGGGGGGGSCFVAGTFVSTWGGFKPIEQIKKGNIVLSYNEQTGLNEYSEVLQTMIHDTTELIYTLYIKDEQLRVTGIHRFLIIDKITCGVPQWVHAADLKVGDWAMFADGSWHVIHKIEKHLEHQIVYNFEVSGNHNYYVGRNQILAHNKGSCFIAGTKISTSLGFKNIETIKPRDIVLSYNEQTKQNEYSSVVQTMIHDTKESIYTLYIKNEKLRVTGVHRFFITHNIINKTTQWIQAENLHVGDWVLCADGTWHVIWKIEVNIEQQTVYNFEVSNNHNYYVGCNQILAHNKGGKKGGGKKGGGGGKAKTIESKEEKEHEKDYYEEVNSQLDKTEKLLSNIEKEEDRLIGDKARANQNKQLNLLQKEVELNKEKLKLQRQELRDVDKRIKKQDKLAEKLAAENGVLFNIPDVVLDEDGMVANYEQISSRVDQIHNELIKKYNTAAAAGNEELTKEIQKTIDKFDNYSKEILENAKRHNKLQTEIVETNNNLEELDDTIEDIRIDAFKAHQEAMEELTELSEQAAEINTIFRDFNENGFLTAWSLDENPIDDMTESMYNLSHAYGMTKKDAQNFYQTLINEEKKRLETTKDKDERKAIKSTISYYQQQKKNVNSQSLQNGELGMWTGELTRLEGWINGTSKEENPFGENTAALWDAYKNAYEHALEAFKKQKEEVQKLRDSIIDAYDEQEKALERNLDKYDRLLDKLERVNDTYQLYYGEDNYEQILDLMEQQGNTMESQLNQLNNAYTYWSNQYKEAINSGDKKLIEEIEDKMNDAEEAMLDKAEELAEHWVEMFEKSVEANTQSIYNKLFNNKDIEELTSNWELQKDYMQRYKDDIEKTYELDKLRSKYIDLLNDAQGSSLQTQNKIRQQMQEQLKQLQDQATVSEYDVKLANAKLEILQKQIALEDAQRNKNQMQLRRDTQGNYRYVYRANQDDVKAAQDDLLDSEYNAYELTKNETIANNDRALTLVQDFLAKRADIFNKYKDDDEARTKALAELSANYSELLGALEEDFKDTTNGMYDVLTYLVQNTTGDTSVSAIEMLNNLFDEEGKFKDDTEVLWADLANTVTGMLENFENTVNEANANMIDNAQSLKEKMVGANGVLTQIGSSADTITSSMNDAAIATDTLTTATDNLFTLFTSDDKNFKAALTKIKNYEEQLKNTQNTTSMLAGQLNDANRQITALTAQNTNYKTTLDLSTGAKNFEVGGEYTLKAGAPVRFDRGTGSQYYIDEKGQKQYGFKIPSTMKVKIGDLNQTINGKRAPYPISLYPTGSSLKEWGALEKETSGNSQTFESLKHQGWHITEEDMRKYLTYKSGGYTGNWNEETVEKDNGKLAFLHQKELVLNAKDTENILSAVSLMRDIIKGNVNGIFDIGNLYKSKLSSLYNPVTEQRVEIKASFPNATDAEDIKQALIDLSDKAYQYAHRKNTFLG